MNNKTDERQTKYYRMFPNLKRVTGVKVQKD